MSKDTMKWVELVATLLVVVGAVNWGLVGLGGFMGANWNIVNMVLGAWPQVEWVVYILVGAAGIWLFYDWWMKMSKK
ncbi:MAG: DUF378 domain-containing protein [Candidatus Levybacteria bacterium]|nr:DUF378 domain-containing protein [Candidatus Levybacteria bacterium]